MNSRFPFARLLTLFMLTFLGFQGGFARSTEAEEIRVPVSRDVWVSTVGAEAVGNNGGAARLKLKSIQEFPLVDFDPAPFKGRVVRKAVLRLKLAEKSWLDRVTISTLTHEWTEGNGQGYQQVPGASTFAFAKFPDQVWGEGDLTHVSLGQGGTRWQSMKTITDESGWVTIEVPPALIGCRVAGISQGLVLMDDTGSEWKRDGEKFDFTLYPNRYVFSRDSNRSSEPYFLFTLNEAKDEKSPPAPVQFEQLKPTAIDPRRSIEWSVPASIEATDIVGFVAWFDGKPLPQYVVPAYLGNPRVTMSLDPQLYDWDSSRAHAFEIAAVDAAGNQSAKAKLTIDPQPVGNKVPQVFQERSSTTGSSSTETNEKTVVASDWNDAAPFGTSKLAVIDPLDKVLPDNGTFIPEVPQRYLRKNALWDAQAPRISLAGGAGEWVGFQIAMRDPPKSFALHCQQTSKEQKPIEVRLEVSEYGVVPSELGKVPDPLILKSTSIGAIDALTLKSPDQKYASWLVEVFIPNSTKAGKLGLEVALKTEQQAMVIPVEIEVWPWQVPTQLGFLPEMNCYGLPPNEIDYYRLGQRHRVLVHRVPYTQSGQVTEGCGPAWDGKRLDFTAWDQRFQSLFDGSAFKDSARGATPVECFYLPLHENWPLTMDQNYRGGYWADEAFPKEYAETFSKVTQHFAEHFQQKGWTQTRFLGFLNNKVDFKKRGWSRGSSIWLLDEPASFQDFVALAYYGRAFHEGLKNLPAASANKVHMEFRADISRPQWQRDLMDGLLQYNVVSQSAFRQYHRMVMDRKWRTNQTVMVYGTTNHPTKSNAQALAWCWDSWLRGGDGVIPWQTIGRGDSWNQADELALFYPSKEGVSKPPHASIRLKAYMVGQQDSELLQRYANKLGIDRFQFGQALLEQLPLKSESRVNAAINEDAGWADYGALRPEQFTLWRREIARELIHLGK